MDLLLPRMTVALLALPAALLAAAWSVRLARELRPGRWSWPTWGFFGGLCVGAAGAAVQRLAAGLSGSLAGVASPQAVPWIEVVPVIALELTIIAALASAWLFDDAQRRHRHLHQVGRLGAGGDDGLRLLEELPEAVLVVSPVSGELIAANAFACRWLGRPPPQPGKVSLESWLHPSSGPVEEVFARVGASPSDRPWRLNFSKENGETVEAEALGCRTLFRGRPTVVILARDICAAERARQAATSASAAKNRLLGRVSRELRTPLAGILGTAELAIEANRDPDLAADLHTIHRCAGDLMVAADDLLDFSHLEAGSFELQEQSFDLTEALGETLGRLAPRAQAKGVLLVDVPRRDLPSSLHGDGRRLRQMLMNLIGNAIKFTPKGEVVVRVSPLGPAPGGRIRICFEISDQGPGLSGEERHRLLRPSALAALQTGEDGSGTGLGLALTRQLADLMGGDLVAQACPEGGTLFRLTIPFAPSETAAHLSIPSALAGRQVLVLHPSSAARASVSEKLLGLGVRARTAVDLAAGLDAAEQARRNDTPLEAILVSGEWLDEEAFADLAVALTPEDGASCPVIALHQRPKTSQPRVAALDLVFPLRATALRRALETTWSLQGSTGDMTRPVDTPSGPTGTVLVVEDNLVNSRLVCRRLEQAGLKVFAAFDGEQALAWLDRHEVDLVLMDLQMPILDGLEATRILRRDPRRSDLPVVALTAQALDEDRAACLAAGMNDYLVKPIDKDRLLDTVRRYLSPAATTRSLH